MIRSLLIPLCLFLLAGCGPDLEEVFWPADELEISVASPIQHIEMIDDDRGYAVGGKQFGLGFAAYTENGWISSTVDSLSVEVILDFSCKDSVCLGAGFFSRVYKKSKNEPWSVMTLPEGRRLSTVLPMDDGWILAGGQGLQSGIIQKLDHMGDVLWTRDSFIHEFADTYAFSDEHWWVVGYGIIMQTRDGGQTWEVNQNQGDFYTSIDFVNDQVGYVVGEFGSILKTSNGGESWEELRDGDEVFNRGLTFWDVAFWTEEQGVIAGSNGLIWYTDNGGDTWQEVKGLPSVDWYTCTVQTDHLLFGGSDGTIAKAPLP
jgi:photosystem II stability/assembly factor-like uncharacterized protein